MKNKKLIIDILLKADEKQLSAIAAKTKKMLAKTNPEIKFDEDKFVEEVNGLKKLLGDLKVDIPMGDAEKNVTHLSDRFAKLSLTLMGVQQAAQAIGDISQPFIELDTATNRIKTLGGEAKKLAPALRDISIEMSANVPITAPALQSATYDALSAGINATKKDIGDFMKAASELAVGGGENIGNSVNLLSSLVNAYGESADQTAKYSDYLFETVNLGKTSIPELNAGLSQVVPTASAAGIAFKNIGASLSLMTANGIPTQQATTKLNALLIELQKPGTALAKILKKAGVSLASLKNETLPANLEHISKALKEAGLSATQAFSSSEAGAAFNVLSKDIGKFKGTLAQFDNATGTTKAAFDDMSQSLENQSKKAEIYLQNMSIKAVDALGPMGSSAILAAKGLGTMTPYLMSMASIKSLIPPGSIASIGKMGSAVKNVIPAIRNAGLAQKAFNLIMMSNPYVLAAAGLAALTLGGIALYGIIHKSTEEKLKDAEAEQKNIDVMIKSIDTQKKVITTKQNLVEEFEKEGKAAMNNNDLLLKLANAYPGVINPAKTYAENLKNIKKAYEEQNNELDKLETTAADLQNKKIEIEVMVSVLKIEKAQEDLEDALSPSWWKSIITKGMADINANIFSASIISAINNSTNIAEVQKAWYDAQFKILNNPDLDREQKDNAIAKLKNLIDAQKAALKNIPNQWDEMEKAGRSASEIMSILTHDYNLGALQISNIYKSTKKQIALEKQQAEAKAKADKDALDKDNKKKLTAEQIAAAKRKYLANQKKEYDNKKYILDAELKSYKIAQDKSIIEQNRKRNSADDLLLAMKSLDIQKEQIALAEKYKIGDNKIQKMKVQLEVDKNKVLELKTKVNLDDEALAKLQDDLDTKKLQMQIELNPDSDAFDTLLSKYKSALDSIKSDINNNNSQIQKLEADMLSKLANANESETENIELAYKAQINALKKKNIKKEGEELESTSKIKELYDKYYQYRLDALNSFYDDASNKLQDYYAKEIDELNHFSDIWNQAVSQSLDENNKNSHLSIEADKEAKLKSLDDLHDKQIVSDEYYQERKKQIEDKARSESIKADKIANDMKMLNESMIKGESLKAQNDADVALLKLKKENTGKEIKLLEDKQEALKKAGKSLSFADANKLAELQQQFDDAGKTIDEKSSNLTTSVGIAGQGLSDAMTDMFAGDPEAAKNALKASFSAIFGVFVQALKKQISATVTEALLAWFGEKNVVDLPIYVKLGLLPAMQSVISGALNALAQPVFSELQSWPTGGRVDQPTMGIVGDASRLGSQNREWIFNDPQLIATVQMASASQNQSLVKELRQVKSLLASQSLETKLTGDTIAIALRRNDYKKSARSR